MQTHDSKSAHTAQPYGYSPRRSVLKMIAGIPFAAGGIVLAEQMSPRERVEDLSAQLVEAMNHLDQSRTYRCEVSADYGFALICGDKREAV